MTHQSGIRANEDVLSQLAECKRRLFRSMQLVIEDESIRLKKKIPSEGSWSQDYNYAVLPMLDKNRPCYVFFRLDTTGALGYQWLLINWVPEDSSVREKMLYASTRATLRKQFGESDIKEEISGSVIEDVDLKGYRKHLDSKDAPAPYTDAELEKARLFSHDLCASSSAPRQTVGNVSFAITDASKPILFAFRNGDCDYIELEIDMDDEKIKVSNSRSRLEPRALATIYSGKDGRYHLYRFRYKHEGNDHSPVFFIHSISGYQSSIKSRMLYSSCKAALLSQLDHAFQIQINYRIETDSMNELTPEYLLDIIYPTPPSAQAKFDKPQGPKGRRPRTQMLNFS